MLPVVLAAYEYWFGERRFRVLIPFLLVSLSFGLQGLLRNPNQNNAYAIRPTLAALTITVPFYSKRFLMFPFGGLILFALGFLRDRRIWFGLVAASFVMIPILFLPERRFEAYIYLPLALASVAMAAAATHTNPVWAWIAILVWMFFNVRQLRHERKTTLALDDQAFAYVSEIVNWSARNPEVTTLVYDGLPDNFHEWGTIGAWKIAHRTAGPMPVWSADSVGGESATGIFAAATWDSQRRSLLLRKVPRR